MTITAAGFPGQVNDREWARILSLIGNDGTSGFNVSAITDEDRTVSVSAGVSNVGGVLFTSDATETVQVPTNDSSFPRKDYIILRARWSDELTQLTYRTGTPSSNPQPPWASVRRDPGDQYEVVLAELNVAPGQGSLTSGDVIRRNTPPAAGFYWLSSIGQAPHPSDGALIWHNPTRTLSVSTGDGYVAVAGGSASWSALAGGQENGWDHYSRYAKSGSVVTVQIDVVRTAGEVAGSNPIPFGQLPAGHRPSIPLYAVAMNQHDRRSQMVQIDTNGAITGRNLFASNGDRIRGVITFLI